METVGTLGLKRKFVEVDSGSPFSTPKDSDDDISSSDSADSCDSLNAPSSSLTPTSILRRPRPALGRKRVRFDSVTVYYFSRRQGFTSVPSQGGSSLGMARHHCDIRHYTLGEFAREQESSHRLALRQHLRQEKLNARKMKLTRNGTVECAQAELLTLDDVSDEDLDVESVEVDDCFFLQPLPTKRRRALLRASGINRIDAREKAELRAIRLSREECGCDCRFYCDPRHCGCSQAGIKCQVDRMSFPCGCSREGCGNGAGRIEFNPLRVRTHYLHTIMKLDLEKRGLLTDALDDEAPTPSPSMSPSLSPGSELEADARAVQELLAEHDSLERENETAVLHLQSAEERERLREQEEVEVELEVQHEDPALCLLAGQLVEEARAEAAVEGVLIQGAFPEGAALLCISDGQVSQVSQSLQPEPEQQQEQQDLQKLQSESEPQPQGQDQVQDHNQNQNQDQDQDQERCFLQHQPSAPLLFYQIDQLEPARALQPHATDEGVAGESAHGEESTGGSAGTEGTEGMESIQAGEVGDVENEGHKLLTSEQSSEETLPMVVPCPDSRGEKQMSSVVVPVPEGGGEEEILPAVFPVPETRGEEAISSMVSPRPEKSGEEAILPMVVPLLESRGEEAISPMVVPLLESRGEEAISPMVVPLPESRGEEAISPMVVPLPESRGEEAISPMVVPLPESRGEEAISPMVVPLPESRGGEESPRQREDSLQGLPCQQICLLSAPDALALPTEV